MKKLPIIGLLVGGIAAIFAMKKKKGASQAEEAPQAGESPTGETTPPA